MGHSQQVKQDIWLEAYSELNQFFSKKIEETEGLKIQNKFLQQNFSEFHAQIVI